MKVGFVGCGLNSDYHINFAKQYGTVDILGVVDKDIRKARECADKYGISNRFSSIAEMVDYGKPDVVHIVTPPHTHFALAKEAIQQGCHVLVEKPLALNVQDAEQLFNLADQHNVKLCAMHNHFYDPCMQKARDLIEAGEAGQIISVESYYGLNTRIDAFRKYPLPNELPWLYSLPGGVYHDFMSHPLYVMLPYTGAPAHLEVSKRSFGELPQGMADELKIVVDGERASGILTFSFAAKPHEHFVKFYGTKMVIHVNFDSMTTTTHGLSSLPKAAQKATGNLGQSWQLTAATVSNVWNFARGKLKPYQGMKVLIHQFYDSVAGKGAMPVSREEALMVVETMDRLWPKIDAQPLVFEPRKPKVPIENTGKPRVLVTGATGFLGRRLVEVLAQRGYPVRSLARKLSNVKPLEKLSTEIHYGDVADMESLHAAAQDVDVIVHAAADTAGNEDDGRISTLLGTQNILDLGRGEGIKKIIYISSCSVYGVADYKKGQLVDETASLERYPEKRGPYSNAKYKAEQLVLDATQKDNLPIVCLRPATIFGPGGELYTPMMGFSVGTKVFATIGPGDFELPLVYIDNLVDAIIVAIEKEESTGQVFNVVEPKGLTKKDYIDDILKKLYPRATNFYIPYWFLYSAVWGQEILTWLLRRKPFLTRYRLTSSQRKIRYDSSKIQDKLDWKPPCSLDEATAKIAQYEKTRRF
jgi:predicted dehydrogenase/nucleoside-diphosphate-sugar epimerase